MAINKHPIKSPTEVITTTLGIPEDYKQRCIQEAYKVNFLKPKNKDVDPIRSGWRVWEYTKVYNELLDKINYVVGKGVIFDIKENYSYPISNAWTVVYKDGHYVAPHTHHPSYMSFVYYLKANKHSSPLVFDECGLTLDVYDDLLVVFPSYLSHCVPEHKGEDRVCVAGNMVIEKH